MRGRRGIGQGRHGNSIALPRIWLFSDERVSPNRLLRAVSALPPGSGIVFRHYGLDPADRKTLFASVRALARRQRLILLLAGPAPLVQAWHADGRHISGTRPRGRRLSGGGLRTASAHGPRDLARAMRGGVDLVFLSPVFPTRSHPGAGTLGPVRFGAMAARAAIPVVALGGMDARRFRRLRPLGAYGWAAIDALHPLA